MVADLPTLTPKEETFCHHYLIELNGAKAAALAKYSKRTARQMAHELLSKPYIREYIQKKQQERFVRLNLTSDTILGELIRLARVDVSEAFDDKGNLLTIKDIPEDTRRSIAP